MILKDDVVILRAIEEKDAPMLMEMINDPEIENAVVGYAYPVSLADQKQWIASLKNEKTLRYAIDADGEFAGTAFVSSLDLKNRTGNMNIKLMKSAQGKGIASRAMKLVIEYCFNELNLNCVTANVIQRNEASRKLWEKLGFKKDGILRQRVYKNGEYHNLIAYSMLRDEFDERNW